MSACTLERAWPAYIAVSLVTFFSGFAVLLPLHIIWRYSRGDRRRSLLARHVRTRDSLSKLQTAAEGILSGTTVVSKAVVSVAYNEGACVYSLWGDVM